jgi:sucrose phosphorylase
MPQIRVRRRERAFHPRGGQRVLFLSGKLFALLRTSPEGDEHLLAVTNVTPEAVKVDVPAASLGLAGRWWMDLLSGRQWKPRRATWPLEIEPYGVVWLKPLDRAS